MWCPSCGDEFRPGVLRCPDCGVELVSDEAVPRAPEAPRPEVPDGYSLLAANWDSSASEFIEWLDDEGIPVLSIHSRDAATAELYVPAADLSRAEELLEEYYDEDEDYEEVEIEFDVEDLSGRSRSLLRDGDLDTFSMLVDGSEDEVLDLADKLEEAGMPVLVVDADQGRCEIHVPDRCRAKALELAQI